VPTEVYLEVGTKKVFACAVDWPGWERSGKTEEAALEALAAYGPRYAAVVGRKRLSTTFDVVDHVKGTATTDFGAPDARTSFDERPLPAQWIDILDASWRAFDAAVAASSPTLVKGPRGGGRDRDAIGDHVREAERSYARQIGVRLPPRTPWPDQRAAILGALRAGVVEARWPVRYYVRRTVWHILDHAWEIEDKQPS